MRNYKKIVHYCEYIIICVIDNAGVIVNNKGEMKGAFEMMPMCIDIINGL